MQPYFFPYAGYFRLFAAADLFVVYDCVQFPRRGFVHRNRFPAHDGRLEWLTLPLQPCARATDIAHVSFRASFRADMTRRMRRFPSLARLDRPEFETLRAALLSPDGGLTDYLDHLLALTCGLLGRQTPRIRSSSLGLPATLRGPERILEICRRVGARRYINSPGGRALYDPDVFVRKGIELEFLADWPGSRVSMLHRLLTEPLAELREELSAA